MGKTKYGRILIGVLCVLVLIAVTAAALLLDKKSPDPIVGDYAPYEPPKPTTVPDNPFGPPTYLPPSVTIPPEEGKTEITFPCDIPGYDLTIEKADAYSGMYVEDGSFTNVANVARFTRTSMISVLQRDYIRTARAKGLSLGKVRYVHALKNSLGTVLTVLSSALLGTLGGSIIVETCFSIHGVGEMLNKGLSQRDYPLAQAALLVMTLLFIVINILLDIGYKLIDPRVELN